MNDTTTTAGAAPVAQADEAIITIAWDLLHDSPLQYRQTYSEATIAEIAASIKETGRIQQPLVVRRRFPNPLFIDQYDPQDGYEIVFGHTRKRGGLAAGLMPGPPCVVREMTDAQVRAAQAAENIARADVHPIEEAQGFRAMLDEDQITADELAAALGKSRSYVYGRLKLLALCPQVRQACLARDIDTEVGLLIARVGDAKMQQKALAYIKSKYYDLDDGGAKSFRQIRDLLNERFTLQLASAIFDVNDEMLVPSAGYCGRCPKRTGNAPEFADVVDPPESKRHYGMRNVGADVCTDPECFAAKKTAHLAREAAKLQAEGHVVVAGNKARVAIDAVGRLKGGWMLFSEVPAALKKGAAPVKAVLIQDPRTGKTHKAAKVDEVKVAGEQAKVRVAVPVARSQDHYNSPEARAAREKAAAAEAAKVKAAMARRLALLHAVRAAVRDSQRSEFDLRLVARAALAGVQYRDKPLLAELWDVSPTRDCEELLRQRIDAMPAEALTQFLMDCVLVDGVVIFQAYDLREKPEALHLAAQHYGLQQPGPSAAAADTGAELDAEQDEADDEALASAEAQP